MIYQYSFYFGLPDNKDQYNLKPLVGIINMLVTILSLFIIQKFKRRPIFMMGYLLSWALNWYLFQIYQEHGGESDGAYQTIITIMAITFIVAHIFIYSLTLGTVTWVYAGEILTEKGMGVAVTLHWISNLLIYFLPSISAFANRRKDDEMDQSYFSKFFFLYSGLSMWGFFLTSVFTIETKID